MEYKHSKGITAYLIENGNKSNHSLPIVTSPYSEASIRDKKNPDLKCIHESHENITKEPLCDLHPIFGICKMKYITWLSPYGEPIFDLRGVFDHHSELLYATSDYLKTLSITEGKKLLFDMYGPEVYKKDTYGYFQSYRTLIDLPKDYFKENSPLVRYLKYSKVVRIRIKNIINTQTSVSNIKQEQEFSGLNIQTNNPLTLYQNSFLRNLIDINSLELNKNFYIDSETRLLMDSVAESLGLLYQPKKHSFGHANRLLEVIKK